jgi:hypothetical protein
MVSTPFTPDGLFDIIEGISNTTIILEYISHITTSHRERTEVVLDQEERVGDI